MFTKRYKEFRPALDTKHLSGANIDNDHMKNICGF